MPSVLAIINARRVWRGASALQPAAASSYPPEVDALLVESGRISHIGATADVQRRYDALVAAMPADAAAAAPQPVEGGRPRTASHRVIDCAHRHAVYPGFIDSHVHFLDGGRLLLSPQLSFATCRAQFTAIVRDFVEHRYNRDEGGWVYGVGWSEAVLGCSPTREWLDEVSTEINMVMYSKDIHSAVMNTAALRSCHIIPGADDGEPLITSVDGGVIELDEHGVPNGVLRDNAILYTKRYTPQADTPTSQRRALEAAHEYLLSRGFTSVFSMMSTTFTDNITDIAFLAQMEREGAMRLRVRYGVPLNDVERFVERFYGGMAADAARSGRSDAFTRPYRFTMTPPAAGGGYLLLGAVKLFSDGSLSSRTAAMNRPYGCNVTTEGDIDSDLDDAAIGALLAERAGKRCQCGLLTMPRLELQAAIHLAHSHDLQCVVHAIGDRAVATVNRALCASADWLRERAAAAAEPADVAADVARFRADPRSRVEHCQHMSNMAKEVARMSRYGIIASMQPCHLLFDGDYVDALLGQRRKDTSYMWGTLLAAHIRVDLGSDWPVAPADVNDGLRGAVTRVPDVMAALAAEEAQHQSQPAPNTATALRRYHDTWNAAECISMDTALRTYTYEGAHGMFMEDHLGTLEVGKYADITVWTADWLDDAAMVPLAGVAGANARWWPRRQEPRVAYTIVGGIVEYDSAH
ncbi:Amidohydrolase/Amidohydrolase family [Novymonas esmeraldas]|uniref:Amidohydrolase/Amidohydrolase family n=1 Tax=Novymonas esmeraldas TaxID=1808958 RepID=A0AAW0ERP0_9TRYP